MFRCVNSLEAMVILAVLSCVEFFGDDAIPPQMSMPYNMVRCSANGHCFWSCLFLATGASEKQFLGWAQRPRNQQGFTSGNDAKAEEAAVKHWALQLSMPDECRHRFDSQHSAEEADIAPC